MIFVLAIAQLSSMHIVLDYQTKTCWSHRRIQYAFDLDIRI